MLPTLKKEPPVGLGWTHEVKFDGFRIQIHKDGSDVALYSRNGHDFTSRYPGLARAFSKRCTSRQAAPRGALRRTTQEGICAWNDS
jgi:ATP-dependent DNA ligase